MGRRLTVRHDEETFGCEGSVLYLDYNDGYVDVYIYQTHSLIHLKWVPFIISESYLYKVGLERKKGSCRTSIRGLMNSFV